MKLRVFDNGIQSHNNKIQQSLKTDGIYIMHEEGYSYTVGFLKVGSPDLILYDQTQGVAEEIFQLLFQAVQLGLIQLRQDMMIEHVLEPQPRLIAVTELDKKQHFYAARTYYGDWNFSVLKIQLKLH